MNRLYNPSPGLLAVNRKGKSKIEKRNIDKFVYPVRFRVVYRVWPWRLHGTNKREGGTMTNKNQLRTVCEHVIVELRQINVG